MNRSLIVCLAIVAGTVGMMVGLEWMAQPDSNSGRVEPGNHLHAGSHASEEGHSGVHDPEPVEVGPPVPEVRLEVRKDSEGEGWRIHVHTDRFAFESDSDPDPEVPYVGHAHLYVNGEMKAMFYRPEYSLRDLPEGTNELKVTLSNRNHADLMYRGTPIGDTITVTVEASERSGTN